MRRALVQQLGNTFGDYRNMGLMPRTHTQSRNQWKWHYNHGVLFCVTENLIFGHAMALIDISQPKKKTNSDYTCELVTNGISLYMRMFSQIFWFFSQHTSGTVNDLKRKVLVQCRLRVNLIDGTSYILINYPATIVCSIHLARSQPSRFAPLWRRSTHTHGLCANKLFFPFRLRFSCRRLLLSFLMFIPDFHFSPVLIQWRLTSEAQSVFVKSWLDMVR